MGAPGAPSHPPPVLHGDESTLRVLVVTDTHLGFREDDAVRRDDAFAALEEALRLGRARGADLVLHCGDLFHANKPSRATLVRAMGILREHCLGDAPVAVRRVAVEGETSGEPPRPGTTAALNFEDPNLNVALPFFALHGNHDDPSGPAHLSAMDVLAESRLVNYFGKCRALSGAGGQAALQIAPVLLQKGKTLLALYGMGWVNDARCVRMFQRADGVRWQRPESAPGYASDAWFNLFALHQNRNYAGAKNNLCEDLLPKWIDLAVWGHEHESIPVMEQRSSVSQVRVLQAGSTVATTLNEGEQKTKHCFLLEVNGTQSRVTPLPLQSVRPMLLARLPWPGDCGSEEERDRLRAAAVAAVEDLLARHEEGAGAAPALPLVRLTVEHEKGASISGAQITQAFVGRVANPADMVAFKVRPPRPAAGAAGAGAAAEGLRNPVGGERSKLMADLIAGHLPELAVLRADKMSGALHSFVEKEERKAIEEYVAHAIKHPAALSGAG